MTRADWWLGIGVIVASMWLLGVALEREFIKRMNRLIEVLYDRDQRR
jgi:hypothetical protein